MIGRNNLLLSFVFIILICNFVSAGVGLKWSEESLLVNEGGGDCLVYSVYNPWPENTYVEIELSSVLQEVLETQETETTFVPENTGLEAAIPVEFCFEVPKKIYEKDCWLGNFFVCERKCVEEQKIYEGDVSVKSVPPPEGAIGGSVAAMAVSAPLRLRVQCTPFPRNYTFLYVLIAVVALIGISIGFKYRKPKEQRIKEQMEKLKRKLNAEKKK